MFAVRKISIKIREGIEMIAKAIPYWMQEKYAGIQALAWMIYSIS